MEEARRAQFDFPDLRLCFEPSKNALTWTLSQLDLELSPPREKMSGILAVSFLGSLSFRTCALLKRDSEPCVGLGTL